MSISEGFTVYYSNFGLHGVMAMSTYRLFGRPKEIRAHPPGIREPVRVRLRTADVNVYREVLIDRQYEIDLPFSPKVIVDAGAHIGFASIYFTHRYPEAKIIAIEPEASNFAQLAKNVRPYPAIIPIHAALWNQDGEINLTEPRPGSGAEGNWSFFVHQGPGVKVRAITMPTLMKEMEIKAVDLFKIDIEGAEVEVLGSGDWASGVRCMMIELHDRLRPGCSEAADLFARGFSKSERGITTFYVRNP